MAKPMLVTLPLVLILLDFWPLGRFGSQRAGAGLQRRLLPLVQEKLPLLALSSISALLTYYAQWKGGGLAEAVPGQWVDRWFNAVVAYATYIAKTLWPTGLAVFYPHPVGGWPAGMVLGALALLAGLTVLAIGLHRSRPYLPMGWFWFLGTLVPVIGLVQVGQQAMADRYTYLPQIGLLVMTIWGAADAIRSHRLFKISALLLAAATLPLLAAAARIQVGYWQNSTTLFVRALAVIENNWLADTMLGNALMKEGRERDAAGYYAAALRVRPRLAEANTNMGILLARQGRLEECLDYYRKALESEPDHPKAIYNLGVAFHRMGRPEEAEGWYRKAIRLDPFQLGAYNNLATVLRTLGKGEEALGYLREALRIAPDSANTYFNYGVALYALRKSDEAREAFSRAAKLNPADAGSFYHLGMLSEEKGRNSEAADYYRKVLALVPGNAEADVRLKSLVR